MRIGEGGLGSDPAPQCRPRTCPPGCLKQKIIQKQDQENYCDIHVAGPGSTKCLGYNRKIRPKNYPDLGPCIRPNCPPPGSKPIPAKPLGGGDPAIVDTFLDTFDCQEQPWRSSSRRIPSPESHQPLFRPSVHQGKLVHDSFGDLANAVDKPWKSCVGYNPDAHEAGKTGQWRSSVRYLGEHYGREKGWRSSVHCCDPQEGGVEKPYRSQIQIGGGAYTTDTETVQDAFKPTLRYIPEFYPDHGTWRPGRSHVCTNKCFHRSSRNEHIFNPVPAFETKQKLPLRNKRTGVPEYDILHPIQSRNYDIPAHDDPPDYPPHANDEGALLPRSGKKRIPWTARSNPTYSNGRDRSRRRVIPMGLSGHRENLDRTLVCHKCEATPRSTIGILDGPQHHSVMERNVITGPLEPGNEKPPHLRTIGPKPYAPHGTFNEDIIDGHFHKQKLEKEPLTEQRSQFTTCKPWMRQDLFNEANQEYKENRSQQLVVHPAITKYLYEDCNAVVN